MLLRQSSGSAAIDRFAHTGFNEGQLTSRRSLVSGPDKKDSVSQDTELSKVVTIVNEQGLHARPVMQLVDLASQFESTISVAKGDQIVDGKSPMEVMLLEATCGTQLTLTAKGQDASRAVQALADLIARRFKDP